MSNPNKLSESIGFGPLRRSNPLTISLSGGEVLKQLTKPKSSGWNKNREGGMGGQGGFGRAGGGNGTGGGAGAGGPPPGM